MSGIYVLISPGSDPGPTPRSPDRRTHRGRLRPSFVDHASGKLARRPELDAVLDFLRAGDTLVITKLDRLCRSVKNLLELVGQLAERKIDLRVLDQGIDTTTAAGKMMYTLLAAVAEFERNLISERTLDGLEAARARGRKGGRPSKLTPAKLKHARKLYDAKEYTVQEIADLVGVGRSTLYRQLTEKTEASA